jgi:outer membrane lipoprotein SlyB
VENEELRTGMIDASKDTTVLISAVGEAVGSALGSAVGSSMNKVPATVGIVVGACVGSAVGSSDGALFDGMSRRPSRNFSVPNRRLKTSAASS